MSRFKFVIMTLLFIGLFFSGFSFVGAANSNSLIEKFRNMTEEEINDRFDKINLTYDLYEPFSEEDMEFVKFFSEPTYIGENLDKIDFSRFEDEIREVNSGNFNNQNVKLLEKEILPFYNNYVKSLNSRNQNGLLNAAGMPRANMDIFNKNDLSVSSDDFGIMNSGGMTGTNIHWFSGHNSRGFSNGAVTVKLGIFNHEAWTPWNKDVVSFVGRTELRSQINIDIYGLIGSDGMIGRIGGASMITQCGFCESVSRGHRVNATGLAAFYRINGNWRVGNVTPYQYTWTWARR